MIHPTASIHSTAILGDQVEIGEFCVIGANVRLGAGARVRAHAVIREGCEVGQAALVDSFCVVGGDAQMRVMDPSAMGGRVVVGDRTVLREAVTVNRPSKAGGCTVIGNDCFLMANTHVGHDCVVADFVTTANNVMLAGHVHLGMHTFVGGGAGIHQFVRIGQGAMIAGNAAISYDVPPFAIAADRNDVCGLNLIGIRRRGFGSEVLADLKRCFRAVFLVGGNLRANATVALGGGELGSTPAGREFLEFFTGGKRGFAHARSRKHQREAEAD